MSQFQIRSVFSLVLLLAPIGLAAQDESLVEPLATVLAAEDARRYDAAFFGAIVGHPNPVVRSYAARAMGRIGDKGALQNLLSLISDPDSSVQRNAVFAVGLLQSAAVLPALRPLVLSDASPVVSAEAMTAVARIGGAEAGELVNELLGRWVGLVSDARLPPAVRRALSESWRLGSEAPVPLIAQFTEASDVQARWRAVYSLGRLRAPSASNALIRATGDRDPFIRSLAVRALDAAFADSAGIERRALASRVVPLVSDADPQVRTNALRALGSYGGSHHVSTVGDRAADSDANVRVQALIALGQFRGPDAIEAITERLGGGIFATRRQALESLARVAGHEAIGPINRWMLRDDWRTRFAAAQAFGIIGDSAVPALHGLLRDQDPRVTGEALSGLLRTDPKHADSLARVFAEHDDEVIRATALGHFARQPDTSNISVLVRAYERGQQEGSTRVQQAAVRALGAIAATGPRAEATVRARFVQRFPSNDDYLVRRTAEQQLPDAAKRWGPVFPVSTGRSMSDYRDLVRELVLPAERGDELAILIETDRGGIVVDLLPEVAPLTAQAFLELIDRRYFDGSGWHRVVPNFVAQDGDPRGDGRGAAGFALRDEVSPMPYQRGTLGLARAGPDTGSSQFFITFSRQPHLEGAYTIFGTVRSGLDVLDRVTYGDRIRRIRRQP